LKLRKEFGVTYDIKFNVNKSCVGCVSKTRKKVCTDFLLEDKLLPRIEKFKHLGVVLVLNNGFHVDCSERTQKFIAAACVHCITMEIF
jgi:hypothetical protein